MRRVEKPGPQEREQALHSVLCSLQPDEGRRGGPGRTPHAMLDAVEHTQRHMEEHKSIHERTFRW